MGIEELEMVREGWDAVCVCVVVVAIAVRVVMDAFVVGS